MVKFRFQDLEIWKESAGIAHELFDIADMLEDQKKFKFAEQLRSSALSVCNNIAEGSGSYSKREFGRFSNIARRSTFENTNILILLEQRRIIADKVLESLLGRLDTLSRRITSFSRSLVE